MKETSWFSPDYAGARDRFRDVIKRLGLPSESHTMQARGPNAEPLHMDVATIGPAKSDRAVIVSSGLHGIEGFFGSAVQLAWLVRYAKSPVLPPSTKVVLAHALNPFGFAWFRRWNENNVDLNRNFLCDRSFLTAESYQKSRVVYDRLFLF